MTRRLGAPARRLLAGLVSVAAASALGAPPLKLHVPSPDWRDQVVYFLMTDRFADGDPRNNDQGAGEFDRANGGAYQGGDLQGVIDRLAYLRGLGATAVWITPPVANQWVQPGSPVTGYHGYWAEHFMQVDRHLGSLDDYRRLSHALHSAGMYLVQDIVVNHTGNFFEYRGGWDRADPARHYAPLAGSRPHAAPTQPPFHLNDPRRAADRRAGIFHETPDVADYNDPEQEHRFQMSGLDDLATDQPEVRRALRRSYGFWVREVGVDAFRVDTAFYVPPSFFDDFLRARDPAAPGIEQVARATGRQQFFSFGEGFAIDKPFDDSRARKIESYATGPGGRPRLTGMLNFPLYGALGDIFARGRPPAELGQRIQASMKLHRDPHRMVSFIDNHDVDRFLAGGSPAALRQALLAMFTLPGIPVVYYGTEQGFTEQRASMFAAGWGSGGHDRYDTAHPLYRTIADLSALRREHRLFSRGTPTVLQAAAAGPGAIAWRIAHAGRAALVVMNTADHEVLLDGLDTGALPGTQLPALYGLDGARNAVVVGGDGRLTLRLPPRSGGVWALPAQPAAVGRPGAAAGTARLTLDPLPGGAVRGDFVLSGRAVGVSSLRIVVDGALAQAQTVQTDADGAFSARIDTAAMIDAALSHRVVAWAGDGGPVSAAQTFRVERDWTPLADVQDPAGDDHGPAGSALRYAYPTDPGYAPRQMDLRRVRVSASGGALRLDLQTAALTRGWSPANGFDRVAFTVFIELPGQPGGATVMPLQNGHLPAGMRWHRRLRVHGWSNALFSEAGAGPAAEGTPVAPAAALTVDPATNTVSLVLSAAALGRPATLAGARVYVSTWDYDGGYRALGLQPLPYVMGGGDAERDPKVMDDLPVIVLP